MAITRTRLSSTSLLPSLALLSKFVSGLEDCVPSAFEALQLFAGQIQQITAQPLSNLSYDIPDEQNHYAKTVTELNVCEVIITYTHPGYNDTVTATVWLPSAENWTGRFMGAGGGGWSAGPEGNTTLPWATSEGFAVVTTDGGHVGQDITWALVSPGNVDLIRLQDFASTSLDEAATLGKEVVKAYYGKLPTYSYFNGCSQGGRQGHMLAQRYPDQYDGIFAGAPAFFWNEMIMQFFWPQAVMNELGQFPSLCEFDAINAAAVEACDELDGLKDGIISLPKQCVFDPTTIIGKSHNCASTNTSTIVTEASATVAKATWQGPQTPEGASLWFGQDIGSSFEVNAASTCTNGTCVGTPFQFADIWLRYFLKMNPNFDFSTINTTGVEHLLHEAVDRYDSIIGTSNADLKQFRNNGGRFISWHGLTDPCIAPDATAEYTRRVYENDAQAAGYYRYFEAPGVDHCVGGRGWYPGSGLRNLIDWVEKGIAPDTLEAETTGEAKGRKANLCMWPKHLVYAEGDPDVASSFKCE